MDREDWGLMCCFFSIDDNVVIRICVRVCCFFQAEDGIRDLVRSRGLGDVYKRQERRRGDQAGLGG